MSVISVSPDYVALLAQCPPRIIRTKKDNEKYIEFLYDLDQRGEKLSREERELAELLTLLVENYENQNYELPRAGPVATLEFLMEQRGLEQKDLVDIFGSRSVVSEILSGKRELNKSQIQRLSERFHVSPEVFF